MLVLARDVTRMKSFKRSANEGKGRIYHLSKVGWVKFDEISSCDVRICFILFYYFFAFGFHFQLTKLKSTFSLSDIVSRKAMCVRYYLLSIYTKYKFVWPISSE